MDSGLVTITINLQGLPHSDHDSIILALLIRDPTDPNNNLRVRGMSNPGQTAYVFADVSVSFDDTAYDEIEFNIRQYQYFFPFAYWMSVSQNGVTVYESGISTVSSYNKYTLHQPLMAGDIISFDATFSS